MKYLYILLMTVIVLLVSPSFLIYAQWIENGVPIAVDSPDEENPEIVSDGAEGAIIVWQSLRRYGDIFAQRIDKTGHILWEQEGVPVCTAPGTQAEPEIVSDGAGGAIIIWSDFRNGNADIFAQRIGPDGDPLWALDGIPICTAQDSFGWWQDSRISVMEYPGGAIMTWHDDRTGSFDVYAQRIDTSGAVLWMPDGVTVCSEDGTQNYPRIVPDGEGGAIIAWNDLRSAESDIYAQRIDMDGVVQWAPEGVALCTATGGQGCLVACTDESSGAILSWTDGRGVDTDIFAQRISKDGYTIWPMNGIPVCTAANDQFLQTITTDGSGGAILAWMDRRDAVWYEHAIFSQRIFANGTSAWPTNGIFIRDWMVDGWDNWFPTIISDGYGGAIIAWYTYAPLPYAGDQSLLALLSTEYDPLLVQRVACDGTILWQDGGVNLWSLDYAGNRDPRLISDGDGGAIITWHNCYGIFAQRVVETGGGPQTGTEMPPAEFKLSQNFPNPFNPVTTIRFDIRAKGYVCLRVYNVAGQLVKTMVDEVMDAGSYTKEWKGTNNLGAKVASGVYFYRLEAGEYESVKKMVLLR